MIPTTRHYDSDSSPELDTSSTSTSSESSCSSTSSSSSSSSSDSSQPQPEIEVRIPPQLPKKPKIKVLVPEEPPKKPGIKIRIPFPPQPELPKESKGLEFKVILPFFTFCTINTLLLSTWTFPLNPKYLRNLNISRLRDAPLFI